MAARSAVVLLLAIGCYPRAEFRKTDPFYVPYESWSAPSVYSGPPVNRTYHVVGVVRVVASGDDQPSGSPVALTDGVLELARSRGRRAGCDFLFKLGGDVGWHYGSRYSPSTFRIADVQFACGRNGPSPHATTTSSAISCGDSQQRTLTPGAAPPSDGVTAEAAVQGATGAAHWRAVVRSPPRGQPVRVLESARSSQTAATFVWDGRDHNGDYVESGSYVVEVAALDASFKWLGACNVAVTVPALPPPDAGPGPAGT